MREIMRRFADCRFRRENKTKLKCFNINSHFKACRGFYGSSVAIHRKFVDCLIGSEPAILLFVGRELHEGHKSRFKAPKQNIQRVKTIRLC